MPEATRGHCRGVGPGGVVLEPARNGVGSEGPLRLASERGASREIGVPATDQGKPSGQGRHEGRTAPARKACGEGTARGSPRDLYSRARLQLGMQGQLLHAPKVERLRRVVNRQTPAALR